MSGNVILVLNSYNGTTPVGGGVYKFTDDSSPPVIWTHLNTDAPFLFKSDTQVTNFTQSQFVNFPGRDEVVSINVFGASVTIGALAFRFFSNLTSVTGNITVVGSAAFSSVTSLTTLQLNLTETIEASAFSSCTGLLTLALPSSMKSIGNAAFYSCSNLQWVYIPKGSNGSIPNDIDFPTDESAFQLCTSLTKFGTDVYDDAAWNYFNTHFHNVRKIIGWPCFLEDTKILCQKDGQETYLKVQDIRKGNLVKTLHSGYVPVDSIGTTQIYNSGDDKRSQHRLYRCTQANYPELTEDLIMTGSHSILVDNLTDAQRTLTDELLGRIFVTEQKYRLMACVDERSSPYEKQGTFNIYHMALENENYYFNYGIYANGLLVETCSKRYMNELSGMTLLG